MKAWTFGLLSCTHVLFVAVTAWPSSGAEPYPTNAVTFQDPSYPRSEHDTPTNKWATDYRKADTRRCEVTARERLVNYYTPCRRVRSPDEFFGTEEEQRKAELEFGTQNMERYVNELTALFEQPYPFAPIFLAPSVVKQKGKERPFPLNELVHAAEKMSFEKSIAKWTVEEIWGVMNYQWATNLSFEDVSGHEALRVGYDFWLRTAEQEPTVCEQPKAKLEHRSPKCLAVIRLISASSRIEPENFTDGVAICFTDSKKRNFLFSCSLMAYQTKDKKYVKAVIGPPQHIGAAFADDFGVFKIVCTFQSAALKAKLMQIKSAFGLEGVYHVDKAIGIDAESSFHRFDEAHKWGRIKLIASEPAESSSLIERQIAFNMMGKWWNQNREGRAMPTFEDEDVVEFKHILESVVGEDACNIVARGSGVSFTTQ